MKRTLSIFVFWALFFSAVFGQTTKVGGSGTSKIGGSGTSKVNLAAPALTFSTQPDGAITGTNFTQQPVVTAKNVNGATDSTFQGNVTIALVKSSGSLSGTATVAAVNGVATFSGLKITGAGHGLLEATATGYTTVRSGLVTVNNAAQSAKTALTFGAATSDKIDCGSGTTLDNLTNAGAITVLARVKRNTTGNSQYIATKYNTGDTGWALSITDSTATGEIAVNVGRATTGALVVSNSTNNVVVGTWYDVGFTYNAGTTKIYRAATGSAIVEVSGYEAASDQGSGTANTDAGANLYIGNIQIAPTNPVKADVEWVAVFNVVLTAQQMAQVQLGFDANDTARITAISGCKGLWQCNSASSVTDASGNSNTGTVSGPTTTTGQTIYSPTVWGNSSDATNVSNLYKQVISHGTVSFSTTATSVDVGMYRTSDLGATYDNQAAVAVYEGNTYKGQLLATPSTGGYSYATLALTAGSKTVTFENSVHTRTGTADTGVDAPGANVVSIKFNASATELIPPTPTITWLSINDSVNDGYMTNPVGSNGPNSVMRAFLSGYTGSTVYTTWAYGGRPWYQLASDASARTTSTGIAEGFNPDYIVVNLGANDYINQSVVWTPTNCQTGVAAWLALMHTTVPKAKIFLIVPYTMASGEGANPTYTMNNYRNAIATAAIGLPYVVIIDGPLVWDGTNNSDGVHPNNTGAASVVTGLKRYLGLN